ncbi:RagB/SusD domain-containing protein [gut metagenome]|uniref:RagB/SusD domain-containing protein n=1 Tax=gut metagenome TaxID=749906 RepID=J9FRF9_9ZZZZ
MAPSSTWKTEGDVKQYVVGCYNGLLDAGSLLYLDCGSDIGYNNFPWEGWRAWGDGSLSEGNTGASFYSYNIIRRCNEVLANIDKVSFSDENVKKDLIAQVKTIRAYRYFLMNWWYGGVPIIGTYYSDKEAQVPRDSESKVREQIAQDLDDAIKGGINEKPEARGRIAKGAALAIQMREALYYGDWEKAKKAAQDIINLNQYELDRNYENLFRLSGVDSKEIILADQRIESIFGLGTIGQMYNNVDGGWSSIVPTQNLIDMYEMKNGLTKEESGSGYDEKHPFANRDPRMDMTVLYPGQEWRGNILNTLDEYIGDKKNKNYPMYTDNASKTALTWAKYLDPMSQYGDIWESGACVIVFRYAEVLLSWAEAENELNGPSKQVYDYLDKIRARVGMPKVDQTKYATKEKLRELIRRERCVELAGEGLRRADLVRWKDANGKMLAETLMNGPLNRIVGTVNNAEADPTKRATVTGKAEIEKRKFEPKHRYLPFSTDQRDRNPKLEQNPGY